MSPRRITVYVVDLSTATKKRPYLYFQWLDPTTGKRRTKSSKCKTQRDAKREAFRWEEHLNSLVPTGDGLMPWSAFCDLYCEEVPDQFEPKRFKRIESVIDIFTEHADPATLRDITTAVLTRYAAKLRSLGRSELTITTHLGIIRLVLTWAVENGHLAAVPKMPATTRGKRSRSKGRPLTGPEFVKMLRATSGIVGRPAARSWRRLLIGLWLSGLRLDEALSLTWGDGTRHESALWIDTAGKYPLMGITAESEKGRQDRLLPLTPDFGRWLLKVPGDKRVSHVFPVVKQRRQFVRRLDHVSKVVSRIGEASKVTVNASGKFASAHDLRRSFGLRWASRVMPAELQQLMRHENIATTMTFYALVEATAFAERLWKSDATPDTTPNRKT